MVLPMFLISILMESSIVSPIDWIYLKCGTLAPFLSHGHMRCIQHTLTGLYIWYYIPVCFHKELRLDSTCKTKKTAKSSPNHTTHVFPGSLQFFPGCSQIVSSNPGQPQTIATFAASFHLHFVPFPHRAGVLRWCHLHSPPLCRKAEFGAPENWEPPGKGCLCCSWHESPLILMLEIEIYENLKMDVSLLHITMFKYV